MAISRRLVFGEVADLYDRRRPSYPDELIDDLVALAGLDGAQTVLEVGAGTGKATAMFAVRGIPVLAVEPSAEMAAVARRNCAAYAGVQIEQSDFERWRPAGRQFALVFAAQSWHWIAQTYSPSAYAELIGTLSEMLLMEGEQLRSLQAAIAAAIDAGGGSLTMSYVTRLCVARAV